MAEAYAVHGDRVSLIARNGDALARARSEIVSKFPQSASRVEIAAADVADSVAITAAILSLEARLGPADILIACAGIVEPGIFQDQSSEAFEQQVSINLMGSVHAVRAVYAGMAARGRGQILLVSSGAGLIGIHGYSAYCASKFALRGFAEALRAEAKLQGVRVSICYPPDTDTPQLARERPARPPQAEVVMGTVKAWTPEAIARRMVRHVERGGFELYFTPTLFALARLGPLVRPLIDAWFDRASRRLKR